MRTNALPADSGGKCDKILTQDLKRTVAYTTYNMCRKTVIVHWIIDMIRQYKT